MPRPPRLHVPGGFYHVVLRGNHREPLFASPYDRQALNTIVAEVLGKVDARCHAFCWMTNHLHALVQIHDRPLGQLMQRVAMRYARYRHKSMRTTGHLFERRYRAKLVEVDPYFLTLVRYIHMNPVKARMVSDPADYPWSSHRAFLRLETLPWLTTDFALSLFASNTTAARSAYLQFMQQPIDEREIEQGNHTQDPRVLGTDTFLSTLPSTPCRPQSSLTLPQLAEQICAEHEVDLAVICSRSARRSLTPIRLAILRQALALRTASLTELARFLNRDPSALSKLLARHG